MRTGTLVLVWAMLLLLLGSSVGVTFVPIGGWRQVASLLIACIKAALIFWVFMGLRRAPGLMRLAATCAMTFLAIMFTLLSSDYLTRGWLEDAMPAVAAPLRAE